MVVLLPLGLFRVWSERRTALKLLAAGATIFIAFGAFRPSPRGAALGVAIPILLMTVLRYIRPSQLISLAIGLALLLTIQPTYAERLLSIEAVAGATGTKGSSAVEDGS